MISRNQHIFGRSDQRPIPIRVIRRHFIRVIRDSKGVTLVELMVALAVASLLMLGVIAAFQTVQRTAAIGEARAQIYPNARAALDLMSREIRNAYIDNRNRDFVFISADGLAGRGSSIIEYYANPTPPPDYIITYRGLGNAQTPHGIDPTGDLVFALYADESFGGVFTALSVKAINDIYTLSPGPPDRLDFTCLTSNFPDNTANESRLAEVRYCVTTETFVDDVDNDYDTNADELDNDPPGGGGLTGLGDLIPMDPNRPEDFHPDTGKIKALDLFQLRRGIDITPDKNPFSANDLTTQGEPLPVPANAASTLGRYPARDFEDFKTGTANNGENIGSYIYDLQFEFYGKIAIALDSTGAPNTWGVGWGYQDVRGEDTGLIDNGFDGAGPTSIDDGFAYNEGAPADGKTIYGSGTSWASLDEIGGGTVDLVGGIFFVLPAGSDDSTEFDVADSDNDVYRITNVIDTRIELDRPYAGPTIPLASPRPYRIIEPTQANGVLDSGEDTGSDGIMNDPGFPTDGDPLDNSSGIPNNVSDNDGTTAETSVGEDNNRLDSRVMGIWDSRSPDPRNPRRAAELDRVDTGFTSSGGDDDQDGASGTNDDDPDPVTGDAAAKPETDDPTTPNDDESNDLIDDDGDGIADDRFYEPAGKPDGMDDPGEADPDDDSLPKAVRITIAIRDPAQSLKPVVLSTTVWLSTAR